MKNIINHKIFIVLLLVVHLFGNCSAEEPNRNLTWTANSCWINAGIQALTSCTDFFEYLKTTAFENNSPADRLKVILKEITNERKKNKPISTDNFYQSFTGLKFGSYGGGGGDFIPELLEYLKLYVDPEVAYRYFGSVIVEQKKFHVNGVELDANIVSINKRALSFNNFRTNDRTFPSFYSLVSLENLQPERIPDITKIEGFKKNFSFSLIAKGLEGYDPCHHGNHTITIAKNKTEWFLYDDLHKLIKLVEVNPEQTIFNNRKIDEKYRHVYVSTKHYYHRTNDKYTTDLFYLKCNPKKIGSNKSFYEYLKENDFDELASAHNATINDHDELSLSALHWACAKGNPHKSVDFLITKNADVNIKTNLDDTPLHFAAMACSKETINLLIQNGADVNAINKLGRPPLYNAIRYENPFAIDALIDAGADTNFQLQEITGQEDAKPIFHYLLPKINTQNIQVFAPLIEKICSSEKFFNFEKNKVENFLKNDISNQWDYNSAEKVRASLNKILLINQEDARQRAHGNTDAKAQKSLNKKLTDLKDSLEKLKGKLNILKQSLTSLRKKLGA